MNCLQLELSPTPMRPEVEAGQLDALLNALTGRGWVKAKDLVRWLGTDDRTIRELASQSGGQIISGDLGYKLKMEATPEEIQHASARFRSQADKMLERAVRIEEPAPNVRDGCKWIDGRWKHEFSFCKCQNCGYDVS